MASPNGGKKNSTKTAKPPKPARAAGNNGASAQAFDREAEEAKLIKKYPRQKIVKGSLRDAGEVPEYGQKRTIEIVCQGDNKTRRRIATSDLHQVMYSEEHIKKLRLERRKELRASKRKDKAAKNPRPTTAKAGASGKSGAKAKAGAKGGKVTARRGGNNRTTAPAQAAEPVAAGATAE